MLLATPTLHLADRSPITVQVTGFRPHERVTVTVVSGRRWTKAGSTGLTGALRVTFPGTRLARCAVYRLSAVGAHGEIAWLRPPAPMCVPA